MPLILPSRWPRGSLEFVAEQAARAAALNSFVFAPMGSPSWWQPESMAEGGGGKRRKTSDDGLSGCNQHCAPSARKQSLEAIIGSDEDEEEEQGEEEDAIGNGESEAVEGSEAEEESAEEQRVEESEGESIEGESEDEEESEGESERAVRRFQQDHPPTAPLGA